MNLEEKLLDSRDLFVGDLQRQNNSQKEANEGLEICSSICKSKKREVYILMTDCDNVGSSNIGSISSIVY